jgi:hypothetical protein
MGGRSAAGAPRGTAGLGKVSKGERNKFFQGLGSSLGKGESLRSARQSGRLAVQKYRAQKNRSRKSK